MSEEAIEPSVQEETQESTGLLDGAIVEEASSEDTNKVEIDHRDPAELAAQQDDEPLERPDWWPENFWKKDDAEPDLEGIAKSWMDLRKQISQGKHKAPEDGKYDLEAFGNVPEDDPLKQYVLNWAGENGISQSGLDSLVGKFMEIAGEQSVNEQISLSDEKKMLGPNADARINNMAKWGKGLVSKGVWSEEDYKEFEYMGGTAKGLAALEKLRSSYEGRLPIETTPVEGAPSKEALYAMVGDERYKTDPAFRQEVERKFAQNFN
jgi:hypothetical protein